jgi:hypothetical protein
VADHFFQSRVLSAVTPFYPVFLPPIESSDPHPDLTNPSQDIPKKVFRFPPDVQKGSLTRSQGKPDRLKTPENWLDSIAAGMIFKYISSLICTERKQN